MNKADRAKKLRQQAEATLVRTPAKPAGYTDEDSPHIIHELQVHQAELEAVNKDLLQTQDQLQQSKDDYQKLYNEAPVGYLTLDFQGIVIGTNLTLLTMLGLARNTIIHRGLASFIAKESRDVYYSGLRSAFDTFSQRSCIVKMKRMNGSTLDALLEILPIGTKWGTGAQKSYRITVSDVTQLTNAENELARLHQQLKSYAQKIMQVQEAERKRIAYELHDNTAQYLSILKMQIGALIQSGDIHNPKVLEKLQYLEKDADRAFYDVRRYSHELRPASLEHMGLVSALDQLAEDYNKIGPFTIKVVRGGVEPELSEEIKLAYFRIAQEALNNARKHAKASNITIDVNFEESHIRMAVSDNGSGFDVKKVLASVDKKGSLGMMSMQERANLIGANLKMESKPGYGTIVILEMPL